jgi:beta-hydroxylase
MLCPMLRPWFLALLGYVSIHAVCVLYVHLRGRVRHRWPRQLTDHSTILAPYNVMIYLASAAPNRPFLDLCDFPDLAPLKGHWETFRDEARQLYEAGHIRLSEQFDDLPFNGFFKRGWKRFHLKWYGDVFPSAEVLCPKSVAVLRAIPSINAALFALLPPRSRLGQHRDPFAGSLRYHLGLVTPNSDECRIYVDGTPYSWRDGEAVLFDETYIHSARNDTDEPRIILFCDVARPIANRLVRAVNRIVTRRVLGFAASRNDDHEKAGFLSTLSRPAYLAREALTRMKKRSRRLYYGVKYMLLLGVVALAAYLAFALG